MNGPTLIILFAILSTALPAAEQLPQSESHATPRLPGVELAETVTQLTGVAISPLLGVSSVGAWRYYHTPEGNRHLLPWFCHPYIWIAGLSLVALCFLKDVFGTVAPPLIKKPLDMAELFESKGSALVASAAFVPVVVSQLATFNQPVSDASFGAVPHVHFAAVLILPWSQILIHGIFLIPLAIIGFLTVWLSFHAINVLIALSPFGVVDAALKFFKMGLLSTVVASSFISPWLGLAVCLVILLISAAIAPWALRLTVFGTLFSLDYFRFRDRKRRAEVDVSELRCFTARSFDGLPARTYGRLTRNESGELVFSFRSLLVLPRRSLPLSPGAVALSKGLFCPILLHGASSAQRLRPLVIMMPRYRSQEAAIASHFGFGDIRDGTILKGLKAIRAWFSETISLGKAQYDKVRVNR